MMNEEMDMIEAIGNIYIHWNIDAVKNGGYNPEEYDDEVNDYPLVKILRKKLEWGGVDVVIPDYLAMIIALCSESPAEVQMIMVDILDKIYENNDNCIPKHYVITPTDFSLAFPVKFPATMYYPEMKARYNRKWDEQKTPNRENSYDTKAFWSKYSNMEG